ncbi:MAG: NAD(P)H-hydrate epimerase, partial [Balneolaceae bacterium]|nr:NAD(P)H-hydrate epimerase [Balneolaceae bacterium]
MNGLTPRHPFYICTAEQCRQMDTETIDSFGIDGFTLMEIAGSTTARHLQGDLPRGSHGLYLCGKGNNAGDALVVARYLSQHGFRATLVFLSGTDDLSSDTSHNLSLLEKIDSNSDYASRIEFLESWKQFDDTGASAAGFDFIVDGMLGTGLSSDLRGDYVEAAKWANRSALPIYSIDIPTGLHSDSGHIMGIAIRATKTFTYGARKQGFYLDSGFECTGSIIYCDLPFPNYLKNSNTFLLDESWVEETARTPARHKYEAGVLYVVAGSEGLTGAALLAAQSAWAEGIGAVIVVCPRGILPVFEHNAPQIIKKPVGDRDDFAFGIGHLDEVLAAVDERPGDVLFGPGIGRADSTLDFATGFFTEFEGNLLIDADGLWSLAQKASWEKPENGEWIITP